MMIFVHAQWLYILISVLVIMLLSIYIIIDIQLITGKYAYKYSIDDYVMAAMVLYMDVTRMFLEILMLFGR